MKVAVVGYGYWGSKHVRVLSSLPEVEVHVVDPDAVRRQHSAQAFPGVEVHRTLEDVVDGLDGAVVATPARSHAALAGRLLELGVATLVEKPLGVSSDECRALIAAAERAGTKLMVGHTFEYNAGVAKVRELIDGGDLGDVLYVETARLNLGLYQQDVSVLWDLGPHDISILNFLLRARPTAVNATARAHRGRGQADVATLELHYGTIGVTAYSRLSWLSPEKVRRVTVVGSRKMCVNNDTSNERVRVYDAGVDEPDAEDRFQDPPFQYRYGDILSPHVAFEEPLLVEDRHFIECIAHDKTPDTDGASGLAVVETLEAAERSIREGRTMAVGHTGAVRR
ncbi:MAG: Gfo/Idh/MocA family protein [Vicinamibacterales bacterium]